MFRAEFRYQVVEQFIQYKQASETLEFKVSIEKHYYLCLIKNVMRNLLREFILVFAGALLGQVQFTSVAGINVSANMLWLQSINHVVDSCIRMRFE